MRLPRRKDPTESVRSIRRTDQPGPRFNYELFNGNNFNIRYWSWNYRGCWPVRIGGGDLVAPPAVRSREAGRSLSHAPGPGHGWAVAFMIRRSDGVWGQQESPLDSLILPLRAHPERVRYRSIGEGLSKRPVRFCWLSTRRPSC